MSVKCYGCDEVFQNNGGLRNHARKSEGCTDAMRFWGKVLRAGECWLWLGVRQPDGYGQLRHQGKTLNSHKFVYEMFKGPVPKGLEVMHSCHVRHCVNPAHMSLGTHQENIRQSVEAKRHTFGERNRHNKITEAQAREILSLKGKAKSAELASRYQIGAGAITAIWRGSSWSHIQ